MNTSIINAEALLDYLGLGVEEKKVQHALAEYARGVQPELDPDEDENYIDWVTINELGLEFGFEDEAYVKCWDDDKRRTGRLILTQLYFYGDTPKTQPFPGTLPFGLSFNDTRQIVRQKLAAYESSRRSYVRDYWRLPKFDLVVAYQNDSHYLQSIFCFVPPSPRKNNELNNVFFTPAQFIELFGLKWSSEKLRRELSVYEIEKHMADIRTEHGADLRFTHGIELYFTESKHIKGADKRSPKSLAFSSVIYFAERESDACQWQGPLPFDLTFIDDQATMNKKINSAPAKHYDEDFSGFSLWHFETFSLSVVYSNIENRILRVTLMAPGFADRS